MTEPSPVPAITLLRKLALLLQCWPPRGSQNHRFVRSILRIKLTNSREKNSRERRGGTEAAASLEALRGTESTEMDAPGAGLGRRRPEPEELGQRGGLLAREPSLRPLVGRPGPLSGPCSSRPSTPADNGSTQHTTQNLQKSPTWGVGEVNNTRRSGTKLPSQNRRRHRDARGNQPQGRRVAHRVGEVFVFYPRSPPSSLRPGLDRASPSNPWEWAALSDDPTRACENHGQPLIRLPLCA